LISAYTSYVTIENLASYYVGSPDPFLEDPPFEQRLNVSWAIPDDIIFSPHAEILLTIRMRSRKEITKKISLKKHVGSYVFRLSRSDYFETGGILTYKMQLINGGCVVEEWKHQLWEELILFDQTI